MTVSIGITNIEEGAFNECKYMKRVSLPRGLKTIYPKTFMAKPLVSVKISYSLSSGRMLANQLDRDSDAGYSDHESWDFEIWYNGH